MVKDSSKRVVVVDSPDQRFFEQAIFIVRSDGEGEGVSSRQLVEEARQVARSYTVTKPKGRRLWRQLGPAIYAVMGGGVIGLAWLIVTLI